MHDRCLSPYSKQIRLARKIAWKYYLLYLAKSLTKTIKNELRRLNELHLGKQRPSLDLVSLETSVKLKIKIQS